MSVPKGKRKESQFEVIKHFYKLRKEMTDLLLRDFGYSQAYANCLNRGDIYRFNMRSQNRAEL